MLRLASAIMSKTRALPATSMASSSTTNVTLSDETVRESKKRRFVPPPPTSHQFNEDENVLQNISMQGRYSLRQRKVPNGSVAGSPSQSIKAEDESVEIETEMLDGGSPSKKKKIKAEPKDPFATSPRKATVKPIKLDLDESEARAAPKRWKEQIEVLLKQRKRIVAPVDTMGCQENGKDEKRRDGALPDESPEDKARRERFTVLVSLMLSSQVSRFGVSRFV